MRARHASRTVYVATTLALLLTPHSGNAQSQAEWWPEVDLFWRASEHLRLFALAATTRAAETHYREGTLGLHLDYLRLPHGYVRLGYRYTAAIPDTSQREHRGLTELTLYRPFGQARFTNRTRVDLRWRSDEFSTRIRDRVRLDRAVTTPWRQELLPYVMDELYYDSRYRAIVRNRLHIGAELTVTSHVTVDLAYVRQDDSRSDIRHVNAVALTLALSFSQHR